MVVKRIAACLLLLTLAGCYRQSEDSFDPGSGGGDTQLTPSDGATQVPVILEPTLGSALDETPTIPIILPTESEGDATDTGSSSLSDATATIVIFEQPPTRVAPTEESLRSTLPTATVPAVITPVLGNPLQVTLNPTTIGPTPLTSFAQTTPGSDLQPTPTDLPTETAGECDYTIVSGDTLFRIALRNDVALEDLLVANELTAESILQLGQVITIPNCTPEGDETILTTPTSTPPAGIFLPTPTGVTTSGGTPGTAGTSGEEIYIVKPGDTLSKIAAQLDVEMQDIINANNLTNPNRLSIGQELIIPR